MDKVTHGTFTVEREFPYPVETVWSAWATPEKKEKWFVQEPGFATTNHYTCDFRVGGKEHVDATLFNGKPLVVDTVFGDIVPMERIVATYEVLVNNRRISVSVWSMQLFPTAAGTRLVTTEAGAFLDGLDTNEDRIKGTEGDLNMLGKFLAEENAPVAVG